MPAQTGSAYSTTPFAVHGRSYTPPPRPLVAIVIDGCADEYLSTALALGRMPHTAKLVARGWRGTVRGALPSFTNVNNAAIVCGQPPSVTGVSGNFFLDPQSGEEVMMNGPEFLRGDTILAKAAHNGRKVAMVTAKDKLRRLLSKDLNGIAFSAEKAAEVDVEEHGIADVEEMLGRPAPHIYSGEASLYVLEAGVRLLERGLSDFLYLTLSDYVQHKHAPEEEEALAFYEGMDRSIGRFLELDAVVGVTADHGMNGKTAVDGTHKVVYLEQCLRERFGDFGRVICTITDPYVVHHGALGGFVAVHLKDLARSAEVAQFILGLEGITEVYERTTAADKLELPQDRIGDLAVMAGRDWVIGKTPADHDLSLLGGRLRSHGGRYEEMVPMLLSEQPTPERLRALHADPRSFDLFAHLCAGVPA